MQDALSDFAWRQDMKMGMEALHQNETWELVPLPQGQPNRQTS